MTGDSLYAALTDLKSRKRGSIPTDTVTSAYASFLAIARAHPPGSRERSLAEMCADTVLANAGLCRVARATLVDFRAAPLDMLAPAYGRLDRAAQDVKRGYRRAEDFPGVEIVVRTEPISGQMWAGDDDLSP